jgi:hypothetical protein
MHAGIKADGQPAWAQWTTGAYDYIQYLQQKIPK